MMASFLTVLPGVPGSAAGASCRAESVTVYLPESAILNLSRIIDHECTLPFNPDRNDNSGFGYHR